MNGNHKIYTRRDNSEIVRYNYNDFLASLDAISFSPASSCAVDAHWHEDIELVSVLSGRVHYNINGTILRLNAGDGIIINSRQMHSSFPDAERECEYLRIMLHPMLLCVSYGVEKELVDPILSDPALPYVLLQGHEPWKQKIIADIQAMYNHKNEPSAPLQIQGLFCKIWVTVFENAEQFRSSFLRTKDENKKLNSFRLVLDYIHAHYKEKITLDDLAQAGFISKSHCLRVFREHMHDSPINYLIHYRLKLALNLLITTDMTIADIAYEVGFSGSSLFVKQFRKAYGYTPLKFRELYRENRIDLSEINAVSIRILT